MRPPTHCTPRHPSHCQVKTTNKWTPSLTVALHPPQGLHCTSLPKDVGLQPTRALTYHLLPYLTITVCCQPTRVSGRCARMHIWPKELRRTGRDAGHEAHHVVSIVKFGPTGSLFCSRATLSMKYTPDGMTLAEACSTIRGDEGPNCPRPCDEAI